MGWCTAASTDRGGLTTPKEYARDRWGHARPCGVVATRWGRGRGAYSAEVASWLYQGGAEKMVVTPPALQKILPKMTVSESILALIKYIKEYHCPGISTEKPMGRRCAADTTKRRRGLFYHGVSLALAC